MKLTGLSLITALVLAMGCQTPPSGVASTSGAGLSAAGVPTVKNHAKGQDVPKLADVGSGAYASFGAAVMLQSMSDRMLAEARGAALSESPLSDKEVVALRQQSKDLWEQAVAEYQKALALDPKSVAVCERLATGYFDRGENDSGIHWLKQAVKIDDADFLLVYRLGMALERAGDAREAVKAYGLAENARLDSDKRKLLPLVLLKLGTLYDARNRLDDAAAAFRRFLDLKKEADGVYEENDALIELMNNRAPVCRRLGDLYIRLHKFKEAADAFAEAYKLDPRETHSLLNLAETYKEAGEFPKAVETCKTYIEKEPNRLDGMALLVEIYRKMGHLDKAVTAAQDFLKEKPLLYQLHYLLGTIQEEKGDLDGAVAEYQLIVRERKPFVPAYVRLVDIHAKAGRLDQALAVLARGLSAGLDDESLYGEIDRRIPEAAKVPDAADRYRLAVEQKDQDFGFYYVLGRLCQELKKNDEAVKAFEEVIKLSPDFIHCYIRLATLYIYEDKPAEAARVLKSAGEKDPPNVLVWRFLAEAQVAAGDLPGAVDSMKRAVYLDPSSTANTLFLVGLMNRAGQGDEAEKYLEQGLEKHPADAERWTFLLATFYVDHDMKLDRAVELLKGALEDYPDSHMLVSTLGMAWLKKQSYPEAAAAFRRAFELDPENLGTRIYLSLALERDGHLDDAEKELRDMLKDKPDDDGLQVELGRFLVRTHRRPGDGLALIRKAAAAHPDDAGNQLALAGACTSLKAYDEAVRILAGILKKDPAFLLARYQLANTYDEMKDYARAETELRGVLKTNPNDAEAANALGYMFAEQSIKLDEAEKLIAISIAQEPENGAYLDSMGWVFFKRGDLQHALEFLKKAIGRERDAVISEHLGDVYVKLGQMDLALQRYEEAVKMDSDNASAPKKIGLLKAGKDPLVDQK